MSLTPRRGAAAAELAPSGDFSSSARFTISSPARNRARASRLQSQPTPPAPGPYVGKEGSPTTAAWISSNSVSLGLTRVRRTSTSLVPGQASASGP
ncbi:hypothetical protein [Actinophytocola sp.]|uniref:hypothetical protein n=1 Tax=Actinophytocola sp. TaxID=1872138 RepID=UPI002D6C8DCF|nr:hypothetical protein [Actinophytocola sp.]HYQ65714.1 hypothetical protein [Actinophytocola sp.]